MSKTLSCNGGTHLTPPPLNCINNTLMDELLFKILAILDLASLGQAFSVCKRWNSAKNNLIMWKNFCAKYTGNFVNINLNDHPLARRAHQMAIYQVVFCAQCVDESTVTKAFAENTQEKSMGYYLAPGRPMLPDHTIFAPNLVVDESKGHAFQFDKDPCFSKPIKLSKNNRVLGTWKTNHLVEFTKNDSKTQITTLTVTSFDTQKKSVLQVPYINDDYSNDSQEVRFQEGVLHYIDYSNNAFALKVYSLEEQKVVFDQQLNLDILKGVTTFCAAKEVAIVGEEHRLHIFKVSKEAENKVSKEFFVDLTKIKAFPHFSGGEEPKPIDLSKCFLDVLKLETSGNYLFCTVNFNDSLEAALVLVFKFDKNNLKPHTSFKIHSATLSGDAGDIYQIDGHYPFCVVNTLFAYANNTYDTIMVVDVETSKLEFCYELEKGTVTSEFISPFFDGNVPVFYDAEGKKILLEVLSSSPLEEEGSIYYSSSDDLSFTSWSDVSDDESDMEIDD